MHQYDQIADYHPQNTMVFLRISELHTTHCNIGDHSSKTKAIGKKFFCLVKINVRHKLFGRWYSIDVYSNPHRHRNNEFAMRSSTLSVRDHLISTNRDSFLWWLTANLQGCLYEDFQEIESRLFELPEQE